jgi:hypothetical protein
LDRRSPIWDGDGSVDQPRNPPIQELTDSDGEHLGSVLGLVEWRRSLW